MELLNKLIIISAYMMLGILLIILHMKISKKISFKPAYNGVMIGFGFFYVIIPILSVVFIEKIRDYEIATNFLHYFTIEKFICDKDIFNFLFAAFLVFAALLAFNIGYYNRSKKQTNTIKSSTKKINRFINFLMYFTLIFGAVSFAIVIYSLGGLGEALSKAEHFRSFSWELSDVIGWKSLFFLTARLVTVTPFLCYHFLTDSNRHGKIKYIIIFIISLLLSALYFIFNAGKAPIIIFALCFVYAIFKNNFKLKRPWTIIILIGVCCLPLLDVLDWLFVTFRDGKELVISFDYTKYLYSFIHPFRNIINVNGIVEVSGYRYGLDFITAFIDLLPGVTITPSYVPTAQFFNGEKWKVLGGVPNDFVTFSYLQLGIIGILMIAFALGYLFNKIDNNLSSFNNKKTGSLFSAILSTNIFIIISSADFISIIRGSFVLLITIIIIMCLEWKVKE